MRRAISWVTTVAFVFVMAGTARADSHETKKDDDKTEKKDGDSTDKTDGDSTPKKDEPKTTPEPKTTAPPPTTPKVDTPTGDSLRPMAKSLGLGFGYVFPSDIQLINTVSARIVWSDKLIIEPLLEVSFDSDTQSLGGMDFTTSTLNAGFGAEFRYQMWQRRRTALSLIVGAGVGFTQVNPEGDDNNTSSLAFGVNWGVGMDLWLWRGWGLSFTLTNPLFSYTSTTQQQVGMDDKDTSTFFGLVWNDTNLRFMLHAYF